MFTLFPLKYIFLDCFVVFFSCTVFASAATEVQATAHWFEKSKAVAVRPLVRLAHAAQFNST